MSEPTVGELLAAADEAARVASAWGAYRDALRGLATQIDSTHDLEDKPYRLKEWRDRVALTRTGALASLGISG